GYARRPNGAGRVRSPHVVADTLSEELKKVASAIYEFTRPIDSEEQKIELTAAADRCFGVSAAIQQWLEQARADQVYWVDVVGDRARVQMASAPVEVGPALQQQLYSQVPTVVLTSATLSAGGRSGFTHFQKRLG